MSGVLEEIAFAQERQEAEFEFAAAPLFVSFPLFGGEYLPVDLLRDIKCVVDQMSSRSEHCFAGQRTSLESRHVILECVNDAVDYFLRETHATPVDFGCDRIRSRSTRLTRNDSCH